MSRWEEGMRAQLDLRLGGERLDGCEGVHDEREVGSEAVCVLRSRK